MKKLSLFFLVTAMFIKIVMSVPVMAASPGGNIGNNGVVDTVYIDQDFNDATLGFNLSDSTLTGFQPINVLNKATGSNLPWQTSVGTYNTSSHLWTKYFKPTQINIDNNALVGPQGGGPNLQFTFNPVTSTAEKLVYLDMRVQRPYLADQTVALYLQDGITNKRIIVFNYTYGHYPTISSKPTSYGGEASTETSTLSYPYTSDWIYIRTIMNFQSHTLEMYQGSTMDTLQPMVKGVTTLGFESTLANCFSLLKVASTGATLGLDDFKLYTVSKSVKPSASGITITGKPNIGATLNAAYSTFTDESGASEGASYGYWESADTSAFSNAAKLTANIPITAGGTSSYSLTQAEKGKYVRFCVVPVNENVVGGDPAYSNGTAQPIETISYTLGTGGSIKNTNQFNLINPTNAYDGEVHVINTTSNAFSGLLIAAWYQNGIVTDVYSIPVSLQPGTSSETGISDELFTTAAKNITSGTDVTGTTMKVFLWDAYNTTKPIVPAVLYGAAII